jgi:ankyrin repeat protein
MSLPEKTNDEAALRALDLQCADKDSDVSKEIVNKLAKQTVDCKTSLLINCSYWGLGNLVRCLLEAGVSPDTMKGDSTPVLIIAAAEEGTASAVKALLAGGATVDLRVAKIGGLPLECGATALIVAAQEGRLSSIELLLQAGANPNVQDLWGNTPLIETVTYERVECMRALLPVSDPSTTNVMGISAMHAAVVIDNEETFKLLLPVCDVNVRTKPGVDPRSGRAACPIYNKTPLHIACEEGRASMCKALLGHGADRMARDSRRSTPLHKAALAGHLECVLQLVGRPGNFRMTPAEVDAAGFHGEHALHIAAMKGFEQICGVLIGGGAALDAIDTQGFMPLMIARQYHPTNEALHALLSGNTAGQPFGLVCDHCGKTAEQAYADASSLKACSSCYDARYCGELCQRAAWPEHKAACKARVKEREAIRDERRFIVKYV